MPHPPAPSADRPRPTTRPDLRRIDCLILDLFGVIVSFDDRLVYDRLAQRCPRPQDAAARMADLVSDPDLIRGRTALAELHTRLVAELGLDASLPEFEALWTASYSEPMPGMRHLLRHLAGRCRLVLLSNVDRVYWPTVRASVPELDHFHALVLSFEQGVAKPDALAFQRAIAASGCPVAQCWFVDDKPENIEAAAALGLAGHLFRGTVGLKATLRGAGLLDAAAA